MSIFKPGPVLFVPVILASVLPGCDIGEKRQKSPNVILIITDDQGYGDLGCTGNPWIKTPNIDQLASESVRFSNFHTGTTCAPTRAGLMTGRHNNRVGVWHTIMGRSLLNKDEITMADVFKLNNYATGLFGKWHLGDNYPYRPQDRGFDEAFYHGGGGVYQVPDYWDNDYFDDTYFRNGVPEKTEGYCTDVWFSNALDFIEKNRKQPFFCYIATNAPHHPFYAPQEYIDLYKEDPEVINPEFYGMISNIDDNVGKLRKKLDELGIADNTILIYMTDNGTAAGMEQDPEHFITKGYNSGMRGMKGSPYNGGHRVPFFLHWEEGKIYKEKEVKQIASFMDIMPTLLDLCGIELQDAAFDGQSLRPLIYRTAENWPERIIITDTQREEIPEKWKGCAIMNDRWHLIKGEELYNMETDPGQVNDIADQHPDIVAELRDAYENWWSDVSVAFDIYCDIIIDTEKENPFRLTSHDTHTAQGVPTWNQVEVRQGIRNNGFWVVDIARAGNYEFSLRRYPVEAGASLNSSLPRTPPVPGGTGYPEGISMNIVQARMKIGGQEKQVNLQKDAEDAVFQFSLEPGITHLQTWFIDENGDEFGAYYVYISKTLN
ncbi:MAG: arylsulfatase [Bacteroidales bacterium]|nr:arylsulfatase [Bacteroidales bacterium]